MDGRMGSECVYGQLSSVLLIVSHPIIANVL